MSPLGVPYSLEALGDWGTYIEGAFVGRSSKKVRLQIESERQITLRTHGGIGSRARR